jgi:leucine dehydrogenase
MLFEIIKNKNFEDHKVIISFYDKTTSLKGFIAIHNTDLGPALGGTRFWEYSNEKEALNDVLNLSKIMTRKCILAGLKAGGGKGVIIKDKNVRKTKGLLYKYAEVVNLLNGNFYTGEDAGLSEKDIEILKERSRFILGTRPNKPSYWTALGVFYSIKAALKYLFLDSKIKNRTFAIRGLGKVGFNLLELIIKSGGKVIASEINKKIIKDVKNKYPQVEIVEPEKIYTLKVDVYSPCSLGYELNERTVRKLNCKIICGSSNNQLESEDLGWELYKRGIIYVPDYLANSGGLISVYEELNQKGYFQKRVMSKIKNIGKKVTEILRLSEKLKKPTNFITDDIVRKTLSKYK